MINKTAYQWLLMGRKTLSLVDREEDTECVPLGFLKRHRVVRMMGGGGVWWSVLTWFDQTKINEPKSFRHDPSTRAMPRPKRVLGPPPVEGTHLDHLPGTQDSHHLAWVPGDFTVPKVVYISVKQCIQYIYWQKTCRWNETRVWHDIHYTWILQISLCPFRR